VKYSPPVDILGIEGREIFQKIDLIGRDFSLCFLCPEGGGGEEFKFEKILKKN